MIALWARATEVRLEAPIEPHVWGLSESSDGSLRAQNSATSRSLSVRRASDSRDLPIDGLALPAELDYLSEGDFVTFSSDGWVIRTVWRNASPHNSFLLTERCDNFCLMCSQPPREVVDDHLLQQAFELVSALPLDTAAFTLTGGEPTLYGDRLVGLLDLCAKRLPATHVQLLTNGRRFANSEFAMAYADVASPNLLVCIPIYGAEPGRHDYVVQADGAFDETIRGLLNLGRLNQRIELRVVLHQQTVPVLVEIAEFISRNLTFVERVALMGLEVTGLARRNLAELWIDPFDYQESLQEAISVLTHANVTPLIFNHQLCVLPSGIRRYAVRAISDWKNEYLPECETCRARPECGGLFATGRVRHSDHIHPLGETW